MDTYKQFILNEGLFSKKIVDIDNLPEDLTELITNYSKKFNPKKLDMKDDVLTYGDDDEYFQVVESSKILGLSFGYFIIYKTKDGKRKKIKIDENIYTQLDKSLKDYWRIVKTFKGIEKGKKRMVTVYTTFEELPEKFKPIVDELLHNCDFKKLNKVSGAYYYGDHNMKLFPTKRGEKSYLDLQVLDSYDGNSIRVYDFIYDAVLNAIKTNMEKVDRLTRIRTHYDLKKQGVKGYEEDDAVKVGWANREQQEKRWDALLKIGFENGDSVLDFGCGIGDLCGYMDKKYQNFKYYGVDVNMEYINIAKKKYPESIFRVIDDITDIKFNYDWFLASGVFTVYTTTEDLIRYIDIAFEQCNKGVSFNLIDEKYYPNVDDPDEKRRGYNRKQIYELFKKEYINVQLVDKYLTPNKDFTIHIYKV